MANYLPVLLVSVSTNTVPDDSSLSTLPRAQVDYLSHDWQEEDVWKSWRNMTRQKNEIANGMRLENASWRTWWKQRNKLKTVSPETLNWLKDSDVTWLYGPLHTAVDWTPPPKPQPVPNNVDGTNPSSAHDRLDLFSLNPKPNLRPRKPILKHRSISELLTSDLIPTSPIFSPVESEDEGEGEDSISTTPSFLSFSVGTKSKRPILTHTKSDTNITRWGASRVFRKDSPPRIDPPGFDASNSQNQCQTSGNTFSQLSPIRGSVSQDSNSSGGAGHTSNGGERTKKKHISFNTFVEQYIAIEKPKKSTSGFFGSSQEGNWVSDRTAYLVDDGYEEDSEDSGKEDNKQVYRRDTPIMRSYIGSPDEDEDDSIIEMRSSSHRNHTKTKPLVRSQSKVSTASSSSSTSTTSTNTTNSSSTNSSHASTDTSPAGSLSPSRINRKFSSSSSTATARRYSSSTYRPSVNTYTTRRGQPPPLIRTPSEHVTIAPIAPTILKTTGVWSEGFGDEGASDDGFGSWNTKGMWSGQDNGKKGKGKTVGFYSSSGMEVGSDKEGQSSDGTPVELVYVPPFGSNYSLGMGDDYYEGYDGYEGYLDEDDYKKPEEHRDITGGEIERGTAWDVYHHRAGVTGSVGFSDSNGISIPSTSSPTTTPIPIASVRSPTPGLPSVVVDDRTTTSALTHSGQARDGSRKGNRERSSADEEDAYDFFGGPDLGEDYHYTRRGSRGYDRAGFIPSPSSSAAAAASAALGAGFSTSGSERQRERERERRTVVPGGEERQSRSRSRSQSRTPSPAFISSPVSATPASTTFNGQVQSGRKRASASATPSGPACFNTAGASTSDLLYPPSQRGRTPTQVSQSQSQAQSRGRSYTRTTSSSSSWERESGSSVGSSPMGSLSPDGLVRARDSEREREKERENEGGEKRRGREMTSGKMSSASEVDSTASSGVHAGSGSSSTSTTRNAGRASGQIATDTIFSSTTSSCSSSTVTVMEPRPSHAIATDVSPINEDHKPSFLQQEVEYMRRAEEQRRRVHPTPSNSPVVGMRMSVPPGARSGVFEEHAAIDKRDKAQGSTLSVSGGSTTPTRTTPLSMAELAPSVLPLPPPILPHTGGVGHTRSSSHSESIPLSTALSSPSKLRLPPLIPPPPLPAKPSTSFTAVSSSSPASPSISTITSASNKTLASPTSAGSGEHTIVGKAVDIVSSAGAFLGLWQHSPMPEG